MPPATKASKQQVRSGQVASGSQEITQLPAFTSLIGARVQILHVYAEFASPLPTATLDSIESYGATPMLDWSCSNVGDITSGKDDALITTYAQGLRSFSKPIFLRWYWEMNLNDRAHKNCGGSSDPAQYIAAWRHIWTLFQTQHVTNVAFVWCPSGLASTTPASAYYPGDSYVDWIGIDHYDVHGGATTGTTAVTALFGDFYKAWSGHGKPLMIGETGAQPGDQAEFLNGLRTTMPSMYPDFKALVYFDSPGQVGKPTKATRATQAGKTVKGPYNLTGDGVSAFRELANDPYFNYARR